MHKTGQVVGFFKHYHLLSKAINYTSTLIKKNKIMMTIMINQIIFLEKKMVQHLYKLESLTLDYALCQVWLKLKQWFSRQTFLKVDIAFSQFGNYLDALQEKLMAHCLNKCECCSPNNG